MIFTIFVTCTSRLTNLSEPRAESHEELISKAGWSKLDSETLIEIIENLEKPLMTLYGTEWRERGYGLWTLNCGLLKDRDDIPLFLEGKKVV
jgi:hypothetical protein